MGMGMGAGFGMMMPGMIQQAMAGASQPARTTPPGMPAMGVPLGPDFSNLAAVSADPKTVVRAVASSAGYTIAESAGGLQITVPVGTLRKQVVNVEFGPADPAGQASVNYWSVCGPYLEKNAADLLRYNTGTIHGAFAIKKIGTAEMIVLQTNQLAETLTPLDVSRTLSAIAWQADQVEQKLVGDDIN
jgi:hypothetical protein